MRSHRTTGLSPEHFTELCRRVSERIGWWIAPTGRPRALALGAAVKATVMYLRTNLTQEVIAELLAVSQPTVSRAIAEIEPVIGAVLAECVPEVAEASTGRVVVLDGTLAPCWSWADAPELYSGKHRTTGHNHQVMVTLDGRLLHVTDPLPGAPTTPAPYATPTCWRSWTPATPSPTRATSAPGSSPQSANPPAASCPNGRKTSIPRSTPCGRSWNGPSPT